MIIENPSFAVHVEATTGAVARIEDKRRAVTYGVQGIGFEVDSDRGQRDRYDAPRDSAAILQLEPVSEPGEPAPEKAFDPDASGVHLVRAFGPEVADPLAFDRLSDVDKAQWFLSRKTWRARPNPGEGAGEERE